MATINERMATLEETVRAGFAEMKKDTGCLPKLCSDMAVMQEQSKNHKERIESIENKGWAIILAVFVSLLGLIANGILWIPKMFQQGGK